MSENFINISMHLPQRDFSDIRRSQLEKLGAFPVETGPVQPFHQGACIDQIQTLLELYSQLHPEGRKIPRMVPKVSGASFYLHLEAANGRYSFRVSAHQAEYDWFSRQDGAPVSGRDLFAVEGPYTLKDLFEDACNFFDALPPLVDQPRAPRSLVPMSRPLPSEAPAVQVPRLIIVHSQKPSVPGTYIQLPVARPSREQAPRAPYIQLPQQAKRAQ